MGKSLFSFEWIDNVPDRAPQPEGWHKACGFPDHTWVLEVEEGRARIRATDPCNHDHVDPSGPTPTCAIFWEPEDLWTVDPIPVDVTFVNDNSPAGLRGPAEYWFYIELRPPAASDPAQSPPALDDDGTLAERQNHEPKGTA